MTQSFIVALNKLFIPFIASFISAYSSPTCYSWNNNKQLKQTSLYQLPTPIIPHYFFTLGSNFFPQSPGKGHQENMSTCSPCIAAFLWGYIRHWNFSVSFSYSLIFPWEKWTIYFPILDSPEKSPWSNATKSPLS